MSNERIEYLDGQTMHIPNQLILLNKVADYSYVPFRRMDIALSVNYDCDLEKAKRIVHEAIEGLDQKHADHSVEVYFTEYTEGSISIQARFWVAFTKEQQYLEARSEGIIAVQKALIRENITISYPTIAVKT